MKIFFESEKFMVIKLLRESFFINKSLSRRFLPINIAKVSKK